MKDTSISFLNPVAIYDRTLDEKPFAVGKFGEWLFNFKRQVYHVRTDGLQSTVGTEVTKDSRKEGWLSNIARGALCLLVIPAIVGLVDRIAHRLQYEHLHENFLPTYFREEKKFFVVDGERRLNFCRHGRNRETFIGTLLQKKNLISSCQDDTYLIFWQPKPWIMPDHPPILVKQNIDFAIYPVDKVGFEQLPDKAKLHEFVEKATLTYKHHLSGLDQSILSDRSLCLQADELKN